MESKKNSKILFLILAILLLVIFILFSISVFHYKIIGKFRDHAFQNVKEVQNLYSKSLKSKQEDLLDMLEAQSRYFDNIDLSDEVAVKKAIMSTKGIGSFKQIAVADKDGTCINYKGKVLSNVYNKAYFFDTIKTGIPQISNRIDVDENLEPILTLTYPIKRGRTVEAVIIGTISYKVLSDIFSIPVFDGESYIYIVEKDGNIILCNKDKTRSLYNIDIYTYLMNGVYDSEAAKLNKMQYDLKHNKSDYLMLSGKNGTKVFTYIPLNNNDWYIISVLPFSYIVRKQKEVSTIVFIFLGIIIFTVFAFVFLIFKTFRKVISVQKDNERLIFANNQNQAVIFEFDGQKGILSFSGETKFLLGTDKNQYTIEEVREQFYKRIHKDDYSVTQQFKDAANDKLQGFSTEFRYRCFTNDEFIWLRMTGSSITSSDGKSKKFIGTINNVNAQVLHEQELKSIAERDKLTGLLNKAAMEQNVREIFAHDTTGLKYALFVIDLDNFKKVNDMLGHLVGDMAIIDAGKKLSLIFSEKDYIGRFGGDEFCILLCLSESIGKETIKRIIMEKANSLNAFLREDYFDEKTIISVSASVGISIYPEDGTTYEELFKHADEALYEIKQRGKNGYKFYKGNNIKL